MTTQLRGLVAAALFACPLAASAQTPFAGEDFDGGATNGGFFAVTKTFTPDNDTAGVGRPRGTFTTGSGSLFDRWGEVARGTASNLPFGVVDDSLTILPTDTAGFIAESKLDDFVLGVDTVNPTNPTGAVSAVLTFNIAGRSNLEMSIDMGMLGDFESADLYNFTYSIDGGPAQSAFSVTGKEGVFYSWTMDNGTFVDRFTNTFFSATEWQDVVTNGPTPGVFDYHPLDTGTNGDPTAQDGLIPVTFANGVEQIRAYLDGTFDTAEFNPPKDPLAVTSGDGLLSAVPLTADFANYKTKLVGTGNVLTLTINGLSDGGDEYFAFDNILLSEGASAGLPGDANADGKVDLLDLDILGANFGTTSGATVATGDFNADAAVDLLDLDILGANFGAMLMPAVAVPEPATIGAVFAALAVLGAGRRS